MPKLRLTQTALDDDRYRIELQLEEAGHLPRPASVEVRCTFSEQDRQDLRWYLEDYVLFPFDPHPQMAARVERRMEEMGRDLFEQLFGAANTQRLWGQICSCGGASRLESCCPLPGNVARGGLVRLAVRLRCASTVCPRPRDN